MDVEVCDDMTQMRLEIEAHPLQLPLNLYLSKAYFCSLPYISSHHLMHIEETSLANSTIILEAESTAAKCCQDVQPQSPQLPIKLTPTISYFESMLIQHKTFELILNQPLGKFWITPVKTLSCEWSSMTLIQHYMLTTCICNDRCEVRTLDEFCTSSEERIW